MKRIYNLLSVFLLHSLVQTDNENSRQAFMNYHIRRIKSCYRIGPEVVLLNTPACALTGR